MDKEITIRYMKEVNKWWAMPFDILSYKERKIYKEIFSYMKYRQIVAITGLRRVGKTTIMLKIIKDYLESGFPKENIFYFSFDEYSSARIQEVIDVYGKLVEKDLREESFLFVFDEVQKVNHWEEQIKVIYDIYPKIKILISGSESLFIRRKSRESLAGRIYEFKINPLSFREYLSFRNRKYENMELQKEEIIKEFEGFLLCNGFPEIIGEERETAIKYIQESIIDRIIFRDLVEVFHVKDTALIKSIFSIIYNNPGQIIQIQELARDLGVTRQTLSEYLEYLEEAYLIKKLYNYSRNARKTQKKLKKYYTTIINPLLIEPDFSRVFEQAIVIQLNAEFFWRDSYKNEVDIIKTEPLTAIEVKSGEVKEANLKSLRRFVELFKPEDAIVISCDSQKEISGIKIIPYYRYLLKTAL